MSESGVLWELGEIERALAETDGLDKLVTFYVVQPLEGDLLEAELPAFRIPWNPALAKKRLRWPVGMPLVDEHQERDAYEAEDGRLLINVFDADTPPQFLLKTDERKGVCVWKPTGKERSLRVRWSVYHALRGVESITEGAVFRLEAAALEIGLATIKALRQSGVEPDSLAGLLASCESWDNAILFAAASGAAPVFEASAYRADRLGGAWAKAFPGGWVLTTHLDFRAASRRVLAAVGQEYRQGSAEGAARGLLRLEDGKADSTKQAVPGGASQITASTNEFDAFLCHASEDKQTIVVPFADAMKRAGLKPWIDEGQVIWGDVLIHKIQNGLARSRFVVVFASTAFLGKKWPEKELETALSMEMGGRKVVLPILLGLNHAEVEGIYPMVSCKKYKEVPEYAPGKRVSEQVIADMVDELKAFIS